VDDSKEKKLHRTGQEIKYESTDSVAKPPSSKHQQKRSTRHRLSVKHWAYSIA